MGEVIPLPERDEKFFKARRETIVPDVGFPVLMGLVTVMLMWHVHPVLAVLLAVGVVLSIGHLDPRPVPKPRKIRVKAHQ